MDRITKNLYRIISTIIVGTLLYAIVQAIIQRSWTILFTAIVTLILVLFPVIFRRTSRIKLPTEIEIIIVLFIYATLFLGEI